MKRTGIFFVIIAMIGTGSCTKFSHRAELKTDIDTLSYFWGLARSEGVKNYLMAQAGVDTMFMDAFYKGFREGAKHYSAKDVAYYEGIRLAHLINNQWVGNINADVFMGDSGQSVNRNAILTGFYQGVKFPDDIKLMRAQTYSQIKLEAIKDEYKRTKYAGIIAAGEKFLEDNKNKADIITTESGLQYKVITKGAGAIPGDRSKVKVNYRGVLVDGTEFDSSYMNDSPSTFYIAQVIKGWTEALKLMPAGSKWELYIPQDLAYGSAGSLPKIPPYATLIFEIELVDFETY